MIDPAHRPTGTARAAGPWLGAADRLAALDRTGLSARPDADLDDLAGWSRSALGAPVAMVSLVHRDGQWLPGLAATEVSWRSGRSIPATRSLCRHLVGGGLPLAVADARTDPVLHDDPAVAGGDVVAYAGYPLTDSDARVLGALCVLDDRPRVWTAAELDTLGRIARACCAELRLRIARREGRRRAGSGSAVEDDRNRAFARSQILLAASQAFADTATVSDVRDQVQDLLVEALDPAYVSLLVTDDQGALRRQAPDLVRAGPVAAPPVVRRGSGMPSAHAVERSRVLHHPDRDSFDADHPPHVRRWLREAGLHCVVATPLPSPDGPLGALVLAWARPQAVDPTDLLTVVTLAGYAAQALGRALRLQHRSTVAADMQRAMLTVLPAVPGLVLAARYVPGDSREYVGGDWYDATPMADPDRPDDLLLGVSVGDIIGHSLPAVSLMGHTRSMLRQAAWDRAGRPPSAALEAFEDANTGLRIGAAGTALLAHVRRAPAGDCTLTWTNAGHPPPVLLYPDGGIDIPDAHDPLFGFSLAAPGTRTDHTRVLPPGTTVFLHTDGLVERRDRDIDEGTAALVELLCGIRDRTPQDIVTTAVDTLAPNAEDDVVALALRLLPAETPS